MFDPKTLRTLADDHKGVLRDLQYIEDTLNKQFYKMGDTVRALVLAVAANEPLLLVGKPGTAKSRIIRAFCGLIGVLDLKQLDLPNKRYFEYLLTPFTEPSELFGYFDLAQAKDGRMVRLDANMMQKAEVVYLDEVFNASSAILNSLLAFMNERYFHDRGQRTPVAMKCLFAASNHTPDVPELLAVYDRFVLRCHVENVKEQQDEIAHLLRSGWQTTYGDELGKCQPKPTLLAGLERLRGAIQQQSNALLPSSSDRLYGSLAALVKHARQNGLSEVSNRRLVKMIHIMLIDRIYQAVIDNDLQKRDPIMIGDNQLKLIPKFFLDNAWQPGNEEQVAKMIDLAYVAER